MICPDMIYSEKFAFLDAKDASISMSGILPSWDDGISLPKPRFDFGEFFTMNVIETTDYLILAPLHSLAHLVITVKAKCKQWFAKSTRIISRIIHFVPQCFKKYSL